MKTFDELERLWNEGPRPPRERGTVRLVVARREDRSHVVLERAELTAEEGLASDRWAAGNRRPTHQITLMNARVAELVCDGAQSLDAPGDNILVDLDLAEDALPVGTLLRVGSAILEVTPAPHTGCKKFAAKFGEDALRWVNAPEHRARRLRGVNGRIVEGGHVAPGDAVELIEERP